MPTTTGNTVTIGGFNFRRDTFSDLSNFFSSSGFNDLIIPIENRRGVYYFSNSGNFSYIGYGRTRNIKKRLNQYRTRSRTGNSFWKAYMEKCGTSLFDSHFRSSVECCLQLGTISFNPKAIFTTNDEELLSVEDPNVGQKTKLKEKGNDIECALFDNHFRLYVEGLNLGTISIDGENLSWEQQIKLEKVLKGIEDALICKYEPTYNSPYYRVTDSECCQLSCEWLNVSTPG